MAQFKPGQSGNPAGRPKGSGTLMPHIRAKVGEDAGALVDALILIATGTPEAIAEAYGCQITLRDRMAAIESLLEKGWQKPATTQEHSVPGDGEVTVKFGGRYRPETPPTDGDE